MVEDTFPPLLHTLDETARLLSISLRQVQYLIADGELPRVHIGRKPLVARVEIESYVRRLGLMADHAA